MQVDHIHHLKLWSVVRDGERKTQIFTVNSLHFLMRGRQQATGGAEAPALEEGTCKQRRHSSRGLGENASPQVPHQHSPCTQIGEVLEGM